MEYALIEFCSGEVEIVARSTLRDFDHTASLPRECICDWKSAAKKKSKSYAAKVLRLGSKNNRSSKYLLDKSSISDNQLNKVSVQHSVGHTVPAPHSRGPPFPRPGIGVRVRVKVTVTVTVTVRRTLGMADLNRAYTLFCWHYPTLAPPPRIVFSCWDNLQTIGRSEHCKQQQSVKMV